MIDPLHPLNIQLGWHPSRAKVFFEMALGMIQSRSVQAQRVAAHFKDKTSLEGRIQRIYRFYAEQEINLADLAKAILNCLGLHDIALNLVLDRTNWELGDKSINYLVLAVQVHGFGAVPLLWTELSKKGNSSTDERIDLLDMLFAAIPSVRIASLTADREFIGKKWLTYLTDHKVPFFIRIKQNRLVDWGGHKVQVGTFFEHLIAGNRPRKLYKNIDGYNLTLVGVPSKKGEMVVILTNTDKNPKKVLSIYKTRWGVDIYQSYYLHKNKIHINEPFELLSYKPIVLGGSVYLEAA